MDANPRPRVEPLCVDDIRWVPFSASTDSGESSDTIATLLTALDDEAVRLFCCDLVERIHGLRAILHGTVGALATVTAQTDPLRDRNRQLREWNAQLLERFADVHPGAAA